MKIQLAYYEPTVFCQGVLIFAREAKTRNWEIEAVVWGEHWRLFSACIYIFMCNFDPQLATLLIDCRSNVLLLFLFTRIQYCAHLRQPRLLHMVSWTRGSMKISWDTHLDNTYLHSPLLYSQPAVMLSLVNQHILQANLSSEQPILKKKRHGLLQLC